MVSVIARSFLPSRFVLMGGRNVPFWFLFGHRCDVIDALFSVEEQQSIMQGDGYAIGR